ncbi:putative pectinesterase/pectinesterase inhibitor 26 [Telopea speciosissima]|uniref:putative pectinesterase/pectinesterase inhibitor 26 n=1 Tax=Telopea speciosissima TaxID=54955 RepID=UPI001CC76752|nr:putative pectinesterase/pectinesterase inhibitor 26 [Telopea speciosissima]
MDFIKSLKGYGKVGENDDPAFRRKRLLIVAVSAALLLTVIFAAIVGVIAQNNYNDDDDDEATSTSNSNSPSSSSSTPKTLSDSIKSVCSVTQFPNSCFSILYSLEKGVTDSNKAVDPEVLFKLSMEAAMNELSKLLSLPENLIAKASEVREKTPLLDCQSLFQGAIDQLNTSISSMKPGEDGNNKLLSPSLIDDITTWLSAALTDLQTCLDGLEETKSSALPEIKNAMQNSTELTSNSLAIVSKISSLHRRRRKLLGFGFSEWVVPVDRKLLQQVTANPTREVVGSARQKSATRFVIHVQEGLYEENSVVDKSK